MRILLNRDGITTLLTGKHVNISYDFIPNIYTRSKLYKNEYYILDRIEKDKTEMYVDVYYKFSFEKSHEDDKIINE